MAVTLPPLTQLFELWPEGLLVIGSRGEIVDLNAAAQKIIGWSKSSIQGESVHDLLCAPIMGFEHAPESCPWLNDETEYNKVMEVRWSHREGDLIPILAKLMAIPELEPLRLISFTDASAQSYSLMDYERLACLAEHSPAPVAEFDHSGTMLFSNPAMVELMAELGFNNQGQANVLPEQTEQLVQHCMAQDEDLFDIESECNGRWFRWHFYRQPSHAPIVVQLHGQEFTSSKQLQDSLQREKELAEEANQAKSHFLSIMSHELRTPLNSIIGFTRRLLSKASVDLPAKYVGALDTILSSSQHLLGMINETLDLSKIEAGKMPVNLHDISVQDLISDIYNLMHIQAEDKGLQLHVGLAPGLPEAWRTDPDFLRKILINLTGNAIKFTQQGEVGIGVRRLDNGDLWIGVQDDGIGLSNAQQAVVFDKFIQASGDTSRQYGGTGLGLALCKELTGLLNGHIGVESSEGAGALFWIQLPVIPENPGTE